MGNLPTLKSLGKVTLLPFSQSASNPHGIGVPLWAHSPLRMIGSIILAT
jgi:hypothetical protein